MAQVDMTAEQRNLFPHEHLGSAIVIVPDLIQCLQNPNLSRNKEWVRYLLKQAGKWTREVNLFYHSDFSYLRARRLVEIPEGFL